MRFTRAACKIFTAACFLCAAKFTVRAQELQVQPTPFTLWLDFQNFGTSTAARRAFPIWLETVETHSQKSPEGWIEKTTLRLRFRPLAALNDELLLRLYFDDKATPVVTTWNEVGTRITGPFELGQGLGLPTSQTVTTAMAGVDYLDIEVPGDGSTLRGALLSSVEKIEVRKALDFPSAPQPVADPFDNPPQSLPNENDTLLFGRVKASLGNDAVTLSSANNLSAAFEFELSAQPLVAVVSFEVLNADIAAPLELTANEQSLGPVTIILPDLADPGYEGSIQPQKPDVTFHYAGWLKCQKVVPGSVLRSGLNQVQFQVTGDRSEPVAIRSVEVQLKYSPNANAQ